MRNITTIIKGIAIILLTLLFCVSGLAKDINLDSLWYEINNLPDDTAKVSFIQKGIYDIGVQYPEEVDSFAELALNLANSLYFKKGLAETLYSLGKAKNYNSLYDEALEYWLECFEVAKEINDVTLLGDANNGIGLIFQSKGDYELAEKYFLNAKEVFYANSDTLGLMLVTTNMGTVYANKGDYPKATEHFLTSLNYIEAKNIQKDYLSIYANLAELYRLMRDYEKSDSIYHIVLDYLSDEELPKQKMLVYRNLGALYGDMEQRDVAISYHKKALAIGKKANYSDYIISGLINLALNYIYMGEPKKAEAYLDESLLINDSLKTNYDLGTTYVTYGRLYEEMNDFKQAVNSYKKSISFFERGTPTTSLVDAYKKLSYSYEEMGNYKMAFDSHKRYFQLNDSLYGIKMQESVKIMESRFELRNKKEEVKNLQMETALNKLTITKKEKEKKYILTLFSLGFLATFGAVIAFMQKRKTKHLKELNQNKSKAVSARINPHFLYNSLNSLRTFLIDNEIEKANNYIFTFSALSRKILEHSEHYTIPLNKELNVIMDYVSLQQSKGRQSFDFEVSNPDSIDLHEYQVPPNLLQPIIENCFEHALKEKIDTGKIELQVKSSDKDMLEILVKDNGKGIIEDTEKVRKSFGLSLVKERLKNLSNRLGKGKLEILGSTDGTTVFLTIPQVQ